jgi:hypothetical protein
MFENMQLNDKILMPEGKWSDTQREVLRQATEFASKQEPAWQFQADGHEGSTFEKGQYFLERIR